MDAVAVSPLRRLARACGAGLLLAAGCLIVSVIVGSGEARADQPDDASPGILSGVLGSVADVTVPVLDTVGGVVGSVTDAVAPVTAPLTAVVVAPAPAPAAPPGAPSGAPAPAQAPAAPAALAEAPGAAADDTAALSRIVAPVLSIVSEVSIVGPLVDSLGVTSLLSTTVTAVDGAVASIDRSLGLVAPPVLGPVLPEIPAVPGAPSPALAEDPPVLSLDTVTAALRGLVAPTVLGVDSALRALGSAAPSSSASAADPAAPAEGWSALLSSFGPATTASGSSSGSAFGVALVAAFLFVAHRAWVRRGAWPDERVPAGPARRSLPSPD